jgi:hypothetical protein
MPEFIDFRRTVAALEIRHIISLYRECTPRVLVVTDNLNFSTTSGFGLSQFVSSLRNATIHGMTPTVTTASRYGSAGADITGYDFNDAGNGLLKSRYDVLFLLGIDTEGAGDLPQPQVDTIARFMQAGGGVFATGDHQTLGAALSGNLPRVRAMRKWKAADAPPHVSNTDRHSTNISGADETEEFDDQSDRVPQRLFVNYRTAAGGTAAINRLAHPVLQMVAPRKVIEVFPDHPHEGECRLPASLAGDFMLDAKQTPEWPNDAAGAAVPPEMAAYSVSFGDGFPTGPTGPKLGLTPKIFGAIAAYDGHRARVGRVVTDATWHHFVNINIDGTGSALPGLVNPGGADSDALVRIRRYYANLATWLMPSTTRRCLRFPLFIRELQRFPLFEELDLPRPPEPDGPFARELGRQLVQALSRHQPAFVANALADDAFEDAVGPEQAARLRRQEASGEGGLPIADLAHAALGGQLMAMTQELASMQRAEDIQPHKSFERGAIEGARNAVKRLLDGRRAELRQLDALIEGLSGGLDGKN